jgi:hypothetical protein
MISHRHRCIFVHIPKTGGHSIETVIWPGGRTEDTLWMGFVDEFHNKYQTGGLQHLHATQIREEVGAEIFDAYFRFSFVRNPWDKAVSQYAYMRTRPDLRRFLGMGDDDDFATYLHLIQERLHVQWEPQHAFVCDDDGNLLVDFLGRFETFDADTRELLARIKVRIGRRRRRVRSVPHRNKSERSHYRDYYDDETKALVAKVYERDIELFGYTF